MPKPPVLPDRATLLAFIKNSRRPLNKRDVAKAFALVGPEKIALKALLRQLEQDGALVRGEGRCYQHPGQTIAPAHRPSRTPQGVERVLVMVVAVPEARRYRGAAAFMLRPVDKRARADFALTPDAPDDLQPGELLWAVPVPARRPARVAMLKITERLGSALAPRSLSMIAIAQKQLPTVFSAAAVQEAEKSASLPVVVDKDRQDWRHIPFLVIDPADARDHDDAIWAAPCDNGDWRIAVAIADVSWYVRPHSALDRDARERGNSTYFPDQVVPMLPEALSAHACSLLENQDRAALVADMTISAAGVLQGWTFRRTLIRCAANLAYEQAQAEIENPGTLPPALGEQVRALWGAWGALTLARTARAPLELDLPERRVLLDEAGQVRDIITRDRFDAHKVVEDCMILANVAAAKALEKAVAPGIWRVHEPPSADKVLALKDYLKTLGLPLALGQVMEPAVFNGILAKVRDDSALVEQVSEQVLRTQTQAYYAPKSVGHFGLALTSYAHFTSPIRRYADLVVHRALVSALKLGAGGLDAADAAVLAQTAEHISLTERRSMEAERDCVDRYVALFLQEKIGLILSGRVTSVTRFGLFVRLDNSGADGLVPIRSLGNDYFHFDPATQTLTGERTRRVYALGERVQVRVMEATPITGGVRLEIVTDAQAAVRPESGRSKRLTRR